MTSIQPIGRGSLQSLRLTFVVALGMLTASCLQAQMNVLTFHNDNGRTGQNLNETRLSPANVNAGSFGQLFAYPVDGNVYAQPLYMSNVSIHGLLHNVVFVATEHDSVYALDGDNPNPESQGGVLWQVSFLDSASNVLTVPCDDTSDCIAISPETGVTGTPVIDLSTGTLYVVAATKEMSGDNPSYVHRLHALDITTGAEKFGGPILIQASVPGTGDGSDESGNVVFNSLKELQRPALLLDNGVIYIGFASHGDGFPFHGWLLGYAAQTLLQVVVFNDTPNGGGGGIWQSGSGPASDGSGNIYVVTGNGTFDADSGGTGFGDSFLKLSPSGSLLDYFTPYNQAYLNDHDLDLGSSGTLLVPDELTSPRHLMLSASKEGSIYLLDRDNLGQFNPIDNSQIVQFLPNIFDAALFGMPALWQNWVYFAASGDVLKAFALNGGLLSTTPISQGSTIFGFRGAAPTVSANGGLNGIVWLLQVSPSSTAVLFAYDATNVSTELYNSSQAGSRDMLDQGTKFSVPTIANGKVYVGTAGQLAVFGLLQ